MFFNHLKTKTNPKKLSISSLLHCTLYSEYHRCKILELIYKVLNKMASRRSYQGYFNSIGSEAENDCLHSNEDNDSSKFSIKLRDTASLREEKVHIANKSSLEQEPLLSFAASCPNLNVCMYLLCLVVVW